MPRVFWVKSAQAILACFVLVFFVVFSLWESWFIIFNIITSVEEIQEKKASFV